MKNILLILLLLLGSLNLVSGQNYLNIKNTKTGESRVIENDKTIFFKINGDSAYSKGVIQQIKDSSIVLYLPNEDENPLVEYKIAEFASIRKPGKFHSIIRVVSAPVFVVGGIMVMAGTIGTISPRGSGVGGDTNSEKSHEGPVLLAAGAGILGLGLVPYLIKAKTYDFRKDCILEIKND
ncbi:MAG TPA: hypothetical protein VNW99_10350 [Cytophagaceae bacterium]|jgi:hypothetical protein|nr:hypothetical protein [Cytophagaceae bacterium]